MNVEAATMKVDYFQATQIYRSYRQAIKENRATKDDVTIARAYHAMLRGRKVIDVGAAISNGGLDADDRPRLAIARADWTEVFCRRPEWRYHFTSRASTFGREPRGVVTVRIPGAPQRYYPNSGWQAMGEGRAQVPLVPPQFRPKGSLSEYHLLFEAVWRTEPTRDPMLLRQIGARDSLLFVVLAAWDLTPVEQAVLRAKL